MDKINPFRRLAKILSNAKKGKVGDPRPLRQVSPKPERNKKKKLGTKNKGCGEPKKRRKMAAKSNQINRKRVKGWKH